MKGKRRCRRRGRTRTRTRKMMGNVNGFKLKAIVVEEMRRLGVGLEHVLMMVLRGRDGGASGGSLALVSVLVAAEGLGGIELARAVTALECASRGR